MHLGIGRLLPADGVVLLLVVGTLSQEAAHEQRACALAVDDPLRRLHPLRRLRRWLLRLLLLLLRRRRRRRATGLLAPPPAARAPSPSVRPSGLSSVRLANAVHSGRPASLSVRPTPDHEHATRKLQYKAHAFCVSACEPPNIVTMPALRYLGCSWRLASDELFAPAAIFAAGRACFMLLMLAALALCKQAAYHWAIDVVLAGNAAAMTIEVLVALRSAQGPILDSRGRDASVRPLLSAHLVISAGEVGVAVVALQGSALLLCDDGRLSVRLLLGTYALAIAVGFACLPFLVKCGTALTDDKWATRWIRRLCVCVHLDETAETVLARSLASVCAPELDLTAGDLLAALAIVARRQAEHDGGGGGAPFGGQTRRSQGGWTAGWLGWAQPGALVGRVSTAFAAAPVPSSTSAAATQEEGGAVPMLDEAERAMWFALGSYGWPLYVYRRGGRCLLGMPRAFCSVCTSAARAASCAASRLRGGRGGGDRGGEEGGGRRWVRLNDEADEHGAARHSRAIVDGRWCCGGCAALNHAAMLESLRDLSRGERVDGTAGTAGGPSGAPAMRRETTSEPERTLWRGIWRNRVGEVPYCVVADAAAREVVVCVRGSLSLDDLATDFLAEAAPLPRGVDGDGGGKGGGGGGAKGGKGGKGGKDEVPMAHQGMLRAANVILDDLATSDVLRQLVLAPSAPCEGYSVLVTGHSLGAGVASIIALLLRRAWRASGRAADAERVRCFAFSPPGGSLSLDVARAMAAFTTSVFIEDDVVTRLSIASVQRLRDECVDALARCKHNKATVGTHALAGLLRRGGRAGADGADGAAAAVGATAEGEPSAAGAALLARHHATSQPRTRAMWPPGQLVMIRRVEGEGGVGAWRAERVADAEVLQRIALTKTMLVPHHFPDELLGAIQSCRP